MKSIRIDKIKFKVDRISDQRTRLVLQNGNPQPSIPALAEHLLGLQVQGILDIVSTDAELLISHTDTLTLIKKRIQDIDLPKDSVSAEYTLPVCFSKGLDWATVESQTAMKKNKVITTFLQTSFTLKMYGFLPGFMYLTGLPKSIQCERKSRPSKKVDAGTIALGGQYAGMYNVESPGGWQSIGHCPLLVLPMRETIKPILQIADTIRFQKISLKEWELLQAEHLTIHDYLSR